VKDISYSKNVLKENNSLISEAVVEEIDHVSRAGLKAQLP
jgi:hypothetical protein